MSEMDDLIRLERHFGITFFRFLCGSAGSFSGDGQTIIWLVGSSLTAFHRTLAQEIENARHAPPS